MATFSYKAIDAEGRERQGVVEASDENVAIAALQRRNLIVSSIVADEKKSLFAGGDIQLFNRVRTKDVVMLSRQIATLFGSQISALRAFRLLATETPSIPLQEALTEVANDVQSGSAISDALNKHPRIFSPFYVNMVRAGELSGRLDETFNYLADYLDRNYELTQKARNALIYPAFVVTTFVAVMTLMMTLVIPKLATILTEAGQAVPFYTRVIIGISNFMSQYIWLLLMAAVVVGVVLYRYAKTEAGWIQISHVQLVFPYLGDMYSKLYVSRIADNLSTMLKSGIQMVQGIEITGAVVGNKVYEEILKSVAEDVKAGAAASEAFGKYDEIPGIVVAMMKIGEESGDLGEILDTMAKFYRREVTNSIDTLIDLIEPFLIVMLAVGVAFLLAAVLLPIYNVAASF